jgi:hypothetical protein
LELEALLEAQFRLEGETIIRKSTGRPASLFLNKRDGYYRVNVSLGGGRGRSVLYHRLKFFLAFGWLPHRVDHRDRNKEDCCLINLRPATPTQNGRNAKQRAKINGITSRGVFFRADCPMHPYQAHIVADGGRKITLGYFTSEAEASAVVEAHLKDLHGDFYRDPTD